MFCPQCGNEIPETIEVCPICQVPLAGRRAGIEEKPGRDSDPEGGGSSLYVLPAMLIVALLGFMIGLIIMNGGQPFSKRSDTGEKGAAEIADELGISSKAKRKAAQDSSRFGRDISNDATADGYRDELDNKWFDPGAFVFSLSSTPYLNGIQCLRQDGDTLVSSSGVFLRGFAYLSGDIAGELEGTRMFSGAPAEMGIEPVVPIRIDASQGDQLVILGDEADFARDTGVSIAPVFESGFWSGEFVHDGDFDEMLGKSVSYDFDDIDVVLEGTDFVFHAGWDYYEDDGFGDGGFFGAPGPTNLTWARYEDAADRIEGTTALNLQYYLEAPYSTARQELEVREGNGDYLVIDTSRVDPGLYVYTWASDSDSATILEIV